MLFNIVDFGAVGDGVKMNTTAIQSAIDACTAAGGGTVMVPAGAFVTAPFELKDNVTLHLSAAASLLGSLDIEDYRLDWTWSVLSQWGCLVYAKGRRNIRLEGSGTIDGRGVFSVGESARPEDVNVGAGRRPRICYFVECPNLTMRDITLRNGGSWAVHFMACDNLRIDGVNVHNRMNICSDAFNIDSCQDVMISNCNLDCGDDVFALKSTIARPLRNVVITNCIMTSWCAAFRYGPGSFSGIENIAVSNCVIRNTYGCGIKLQMVQGGIMDNLTFDNIVMENVTGPFSMKLGWWEIRPGVPKIETPGILRNVMMSNIRATVVNEVAHKHASDPGEPTLYKCPTGSGITGIRGHYIENLTFNNIHITNPGGGTVEDAARRVLPEKEDIYPEYADFGQFPAYGFYFRHVKGVTLQNVKFDLESPDARPAIVCDDVEDLDVDGLRGPCAPECESFIRLQQTRNAMLGRCRPLGCKPKDLVLVEGVQSRDIFLKDELARSVL